MLDAKLIELINFITHRFFGERLNQDQLKNAIKDYWEKKS